MAKRKVAKPTLKVMAADWSLRGYPTEKRPWAIETKVKKVKDAGFDGMSSGSDPRLAEALAKHGMELVGGVDVGSVKAAGTKMKAFKDVGVIHVNVQLCDHDTPTKDALPVARAVIQAGDRLPVIHARHSTHLVSDQAGSDALLGTAEDNWGALEEDGFLMEERPNDGSWVRPWRIALRSFRLPLLHEMSSGSRRPEGLG